MKRILFSAIFWLLLVTMGTSCSVIQQPGALAVSPTIKNTIEVVKPTTTITKTLMPSPSATQIPTATPTPLPPTITPTLYNVEYFSYSKIYPGVNSNQYVENICSYLENRWGEGKSSPGTIIVPIMFHSIAKPGRTITDSTTISMAYFEYFMKTAKEMGFSTITTNDLIAFLNSNEKIPERSMILILDDRRPGVTELFMPYLQENDWTLTLGWPTTSGTDEALWTRMENLAATGLLDVQSHGHDHIYIQDYTPIEEIEEEIFKPIEVIQKHFNTIPEAIVWPGGNFTLTAVEMARGAGFEVGFTVYSRGPLMYNWIPLGEKEAAIGDPLMVLPRYWSTAADVALMDALKVSEEAILNAQAVKDAELLYYNTYCQPDVGD